MASSLYDPVLSFGNGFAAGFDPFFKKKQFEEGKRRWDQEHALNRDRYEALKAQSDAMARQYNAQSETIEAENAITAAYERNRPYADLLEELAANNFSLDKLNQQQQHRLLQGLNESEIFEFARDRNPDVANIAGFIPLEDGDNRGAILNLKLKDGRIAPLGPEGKSGEDAAVIPLQDILRDAYEGLVQVDPRFGVARELGVVHKSTPQHLLNPFTTTHANIPGLGAPYGATGQPAAPAPSAAPSAPAQAQPQRTSTPPSQLQSQLLAITSSDSSKPTDYLMGAKMLIDNWDQFVAELGPQNAMAMRDVLLDAVQPPPARPGLGGQGAPASNPYEQAQTQAYAALQGLTATPAAGGLGSPPPAGPAAPPAAPQTAPKAPEAVAQAAESASRTDQLAITTTLNYLQAPESVNPERLTVAIHRLRRAGLMGEETANRVLSGQPLSPADQATMTALAAGINNAQQIISSKIAADASVQEARIKALGDTKSQMDEFDKGLLAAGEKLVEDKAELAGLMADARRNRPVITAITQVAPQILGSSASPEMSAVFALDFMRAIQKQKENDPLGINILHDAYEDRPVSLADHLAHLEKRLKTGLIFDSETPLGELVRRYNLTADDINNLSDIGKQLQQGIGQAQRATSATIHGVNPEAFEAAAGVSDDAIQRRIEQLQRGGK